MIHLIKFLVKIIAVIISIPISGLLIILAIIFWDKKFIDIASVVQNEYILGLKRDK